MIVCSCNVLSDAQVLAVVATAQPRPPTISQVYAGLGCRARCGGCVRTIKRIRDEAASAAVPRRDATGSCGSCDLPA